MQALRASPCQGLTRVCKEVGIARSTGYKWQKRFCVHGETQERSRRPKQCGRDRRGRWKVEALALRQQHRCGARIVRWHLRRRYPRVALPGVRTIHRWFVAEGLVKRRRCRAPAGPRVLASRRVPARQPNSVWSIDFKGAFLTADGQLVHTLTITDVHSHYILALDIVRALSVREVMARMTKVFASYGLPRAIRVDHGVPWYGPGTRGWTKLSVWWVRLGIRVDYIGLNGNAAHEQMHRMLKARTASPPARSIIAQRARFAWWKNYYNHERPHEGAAHMPPATRYRPSPRSLPQVLPDLKYARTWETLRVNPYGYVHWRRQKRSIGQAFAGQVIGLRRSSTGTSIYLGTHLIGILLPDDPALRPVSLGGEADRLPSTPSAQSSSGEGAKPLPLHPIPDSCLRCHGTKLSTM